MLLAVVAGLIALHLVLALWKDQDLSDIESVNTFSYGKVEFNVFHESVVHVEASLICQSKGMVLAELTSKPLADYVAMKLAHSKHHISRCEYMWLGGKKARKVGNETSRLNSSWIWMSSRNGLSETRPKGSDYPPWVVDPVNSGKDCLAICRIHHDKPAFVRRHCSTKQPFICQLDLTPRELTCSPGVKCDTLKFVHRTVFNNLSYFFYCGSLTWQKAIIFCQTEGRQLVVANNIALNTHIQHILYSLVPRQLKVSLSSWNVEPLLTVTHTANVWHFVQGLCNVWVGGHYNKRNWQWYLGEKIQTDDAMWYKGRPEPVKRGVHMCLQIRDGLHWYDVPCASQGSVICEENVEFELKRPAGNFGGYKTPLKYHSFELIKKKMSWLNASEYCKARKKQLSPIKTLKHLEVVMELMANHDCGHGVSNIWLGGVRNYKGWIWFDFAEADQQKTPINANILKFCEEDDVHEHDKTNATINIEGMELPEDSCMNLGREDHNLLQAYGFSCNIKQYFTCHWNIKPDNHCCPKNETITVFHWIEKLVSESTFACQLICEPSYIAVGHHYVFCSEPNVFYDHQGPINKLGYCKEIKKDPLVICDNSTRRQTIYKNNKQRSTLFIVDGNYMREREYILRKSFVSAWFDAHPVSENHLSAVIGFHSHIITFMKFADIDHCKFIWDLAKNMFGRDNSQQSPKANYRDAMDVAITEINSRPRSDTLKPEVFFITGTRDTQGNYFEMAQKLQKLCHVLIVISVGPVGDLSHIQKLPEDDSEIEDMYHFRNYRELSKLTDFLKNCNISGVDCLSKKCFTCGLPNVVHGNGSFSKTRR